MDYQRIYSAFIASRKTLEDAIDCYSEKHHIIPRSFGGSDDADNLVRLTPEDHFFAHLLLAKIHGGKMSSALACMLLVAPGHWGRRLHSRGRYGLAKRLAIPALREKWLGDKNPLFNSQKYDWVNYRSGKKETATLFDMHQKYGGSRPTWTSVAGGYRPSAFGWLLAANLGDHKRSEKGQSFQFVNRDGREFTGTQTEFCQHAGLNDASSWRVVHQRSVTRCGWRLKGVNDRSFNCPRDGSRSGPKPQIFTLGKDGQVITGDRVAIADALGSTLAQVSASIYGMRMGKVRTYKGWELLSAA